MPQPRPGVRDRSLGLWLLAADLLATIAPTAAQIRHS
jgi:hypothetical protein